ncbi:endo-1,4-beta-xylanase 2-like [Olea europaea subsp. europaea]|uniref:Endo-1,4-beta-xylanase 2-like n=1 Tax=Olea europaea subsp. europaea TaxID=158383 RepID=A0A8S0SZ82_OLEEU|nr:endo-1,4-beta-xylanase 2-like [Olea europaea subsp. europaea]
MEPQYSGGMVLNPELEHGLNGWTTFGDVKLEHQEAEDGSKYIVASDRSGHRTVFHTSFTWKRKNSVLSAWLRVSHGKAHIAVIFKTKNGDRPAGWIRKHRVKSQVVDSQGLPLENAKISVKQIQQTFPFGNAVSKFILENKAYQEWFLSGFKYTVFENEMKWYSTEKGPGKVNYSESDTMPKFAKENNILVRGHNVLWDDPRYQPSWVKRLPRKDLPLATEKRMKSIMKHYSGQVFHWDVINEKLHFSHYEERMGRNVSTTFLQMAHQIDQKAIPFLNDCSTLKRPSDTCVTPTMYLEKIKLIREQGYMGLLELDSNHILIHQIYLMFGLHSICLLPQNCQFGLQNLMFPVDLNR